MANDPQLLTWRERLHDLFLGCRDHDFGWPQRFNWMTYPAPYDSHQSCTKCGQRRYFSASTMEAGPIFRKRS